MIWRKRGDFSMNTHLRTHGFRRSRRPKPPDALAWAGDLLGHCARLTALGSRRMLVENHTGILELSEDCIRLSTGCGPITIAGRGLSLADVRRDALIVRGEIERVDLPPEGGGLP